MKDIPADIVKAVCEAMGDEDGRVGLGAIQAAYLVLAERKRCAEIASMWIINRNTIHPDLKFDDLSGNTKMVAHQTGNYISDRILGRK